MASLTVLKGAGFKPNDVLPLEAEKIVLGRNADCQIVINVPAVSREHAQIRRIQGKFYIEDLKSRNGTFVNNQEVTSLTPLQHHDKIKICDNLFEFGEVAPKPELPPALRPGGPEPDEAEEQSSSTVEATLSTNSKNILETQPADKLSFLLNILGELTQTFSLAELGPKILDSMFQVFRQADRGFIILAEEDNDKLVPSVIKTRRPNDESTARFSRKIVNRCLENGEALLSEDASSDKRFDLSQSIADCRIRSVMLAPLVSRGREKAFGVIQLDTQDRSKKFTTDDLKLLMAVAGQAAIALENAKLHENLINRASLERDLRLAQQVQLSFLPRRPPQVPGYEFFAHYESALEVGGDYYDFIPLPGGRVAAMLGDVAGKGVPAALLMAKVSSEARFSLLTAATAADAVDKLNDLMQEAGLLDRFVTLAAALVDPVQHQVTVVNAGHLPPLIYSKATGKVEEAVDREQAGYPLGVLEGTRYEASTVQLNPGDVMVLFTDGVTEAKNKDGHDFEDRRARTILQSGSPHTAKAMVSRLVSAVKQHSAGCKQHDDITIVAFGRTS